MAQSSARVLHLKVPYELPLDCENFKSAALERNRFRLNRLAL